MRVDMLIGKSDLHALARLRMPPYRIGAISLYHGVILEQGIQQRPMFARRLHCTGA